MGANVSSRVKSPSIELPFLKNQQNRHALPDFWRVLLLFTSELLVAYKLARCDKSGTKSRIFVAPQSQINFISDPL